MSKSKKSAYDYAHVKMSTAKAILFKGEYAGKIVCNWTDNPAGTGCIMTLNFWKGPIAKWMKGTITVREGSGSSGYDKLSAAFESCIRKMDKAPKDRPSLSSGDINSFLEHYGYVVCTVIGP